MRLLCALVASFASLALAAQVPLGVANSAVSFQPIATNASEPTWVTLAANGAFNNSASFNLRQTDLGGIKIQSSVAFVGFELWMYQRSDGGLLQITFDGANAQRVDYYNSTSPKDPTPSRLFTVQDLENVPHVVQISNLVDTRVNRPGQLNLDHVVLITQDATTTPSASIVPTSSRTTPQEANTSTPGDSASSISFSALAIALSFAISAFVRV